MGQHQADRGRSIGEGYDADPPAGSGFRVDRELRALVEPVAEFSARTSNGGDIKFGRLRSRYPPVPAERQGRPLDEPPHHPLAEFSAKPLETVEVDVVLIEPPDLHHFLLADGVMPRVEGLVHQIEPIVRV